MAPESSKQSFSKNIKAFAVKARDYLKAKDSLDQDADFQQESKSVKEEAARLPREIEQHQKDITRHEGRIKELEALIACSERKVDELEQAVMDACFLSFQKSTKQQQLTNAQSKLSDQRQALSQCQQSIWLAVTRLENSKKDKERMVPRLSRMGERLQRAHKEQSDADQNMTKAMRELVEALRHVPHSSPAHGTKTVVGSPTTAIETKSSG